MLRKREEFSRRPLCGRVILQFIGGRLVKICKRMLDRKGEVTYDAQGIGQAIVGRSIHTYSNAKGNLA